MSRSRRLLVSLLLLLPACAGLNPFTSGGSFAPFPPIGDPAVRTGTLDNGLTYFVRANGEPNGRAELRLVVNAGSILEDDDQRGLAHVVEHMAFNGTRSFERQEIVSYLESIGMRFGPDVNAYTSFDETVYTLTVPTDSASVLATGLQILEEWASAITFDSTQVEQERAVVMEEWRLGQGAGSRLQEQQFPTLAMRSRYAERLPIGVPESLRNFDQAALRRFYQDWYRPDLMAIVAVGDFDAEAVEAMIRERFSSLVPPLAPRPRRVYDIPPHRETLISIATDAELTSSSVSLYMKRRPVLWRDERAYRAWIVESLASSMLVNRIAELTQRADSPVLDVSSYQGRFVRTLATFSVTVRTPAGGAEEGLRALLREVERAARHGFTLTEMEREKREMQRAMEQRYAERDKTTSGSFAADYVSHYLYGGSVLGTEAEYALYMRLIPEIDVGEANGVADRWTATSNRVLLVSTPDNETVRAPREETLVSIVERAPRARIDAYRDSISEAPLIEEEPTPGRILSEREIDSIGVTVWELENGATLYLKSTDFRDDEILFAGRSPGGTSLFSDEDYIPALTAAAVVQAGGVGTLSSNDLRKRLAGSLAGVGADIGEMHEGLSGAASPDDIETLFRLIYLKFVAPRPDTAAFLAYQVQARAALENRSASPEVVFQDTIRMTLSQYHPRTRPPSSAMFDDLDMGRSFEIYRDRFADASDFKFYLVGSFDPAEVRPLVERYLASLPSIGREEAGRDLGIRPPAGVVEKTVMRGIEPRSRTEIIFTGPIEFDRDEIIALQSLADVLRIRLRDTLREDLGGTYGVSVRASAGREPYSRYQFSIGFAADPARLDELADVVFGEIEAIKNAGPRPDDVSSVREIQFRERETSLRSNHFWLSQLMTYTLNDWEPGDIPATADRVATSDEASIRDAAVRYLDPTNYIRVSLVPDPEAARAGASRSAEPPAP